MTKKCFLICFLLVLATAVDALPAPLNPLDYGSLGKFPTASGTYLFDTSGVPTLIGPGVRIEGMVVDGVAVFTFDEIWVRPAMVLNCLGVSRPLALLSHRSVTVEGRMSAGVCGSEFGCSFGCGGDSPFPSGPGGGGGFGGAGYGFPNEGGYGGASHGDILVALQGGSSGGAGADFGGSPSYGGGYGGGALELGAVDMIVIRGPGIYADGGQGSQSGPVVFWTGEEYTGGGGGGSGGGILVHANSVALETRLSARGGYGGSGCGAPGGGGGGGGRIAVTIGSGGFLNTGTVDVAGRWGQVGQIVLPRRENGPLTAIDVAVDAIGRTRVLRTDTERRASLSTFGLSGEQENGVSFGPYAGWKARAIGAAPDGRTRLLWTHDDGQVSLWFLSASGVFDTAFYAGPFSGWTAVDVSVGPDDRTRLLWTEASGAASVYMLTADGTYESQAVFGPFGGWSARRLDAGADNSTRLWWSDAAGTTSLWSLDASGAFGTAVSFGPFSGWTLGDVAVGADNKARLLWQHSSGQISVWIVSAAGNGEGSIGYGPFPGRAAPALDVGTDNRPRLLWSETNDSTVWVLSPSGAYERQFYVGPN